MATTYTTGHVKHDPETGAVAIRTINPEENPSPHRPSEAWLLATHNQGALHKSTAEVDGWDDLYTPEPAPES
jgi:hypothetical protein